MNIKETFLKLTEWTTPFGHESDLESILPDTLSKDTHGNYHIKIGSSETLFTAHLDNYCDKKEKVNHVISGNIIKTDGSTILGADNKAGVTCLLYMIENSIPGHYYFFIGEEPILSGGCWGSTKLLQQNPEFLKKFKRAVAFDRKHTGSIITRQMAQDCCSIEFTGALIDEFGKSGLAMNADKTGYYTDTGNFIEVIPECTNISIGVWNEHHTDEWVDISYVQKVAKASCSVDWENLPTERDPKWWEDEVEISKKTKVSVTKYLNFITRKKDAELFLQLTKILDDLNYLQMSRFDFEPGKTITFNNWFEDKPLKVSILLGTLTINGFEFYSIKKAQNYLLTLN